VWNAQSDDAFAGGYNGGTTLFDNFGTFRKSGGNGGATTLDGNVVFNNTGTVDVESGILNVQGGGWIVVANVIPPMAEFLTFPVHLDQQPDVYGQQQLSGGWADDFWRSHRWDAELAWGSPAKRGARHPDYTEQQCL